MKLPSERHVLDAEYRSLPDKPRAKLDPISDAREPPPPIDDNTHDTFNDIGNKDRFVAAFTNRLAYVPEKKQWRTWNGVRWRDDNSAAIRGAEEIARAIGRAGLKEQDPGKRKALLMHFDRTANLSRLRAMVELAQSSSLAVRQHLWDADPMLLGVNNGIINLATGELSPPDPRAYISRYANVDFDSDAKCPQWRAFLRRVMADDEMLKFLRRAAGYSLLGHNAERVLFLLHGVGANGKSKFVEGIQYVLGDYAIASPASTFLARRSGVPNDIARLAGARFVSCIETDKDRKLSEALVKSVTGEDRVSARYLYTEFFDFTPVAKIWLATNHKPEVQGTEPAIWERILLVPFEVVIPRKERDLKLGDKLRAEAAGIFNWMLRGCREWREAGLQPPDVVTAATEQYRQDMDVVGRWLSERCVRVSPERSDKPYVMADGAYKDYREWCELNNERVQSQRAFGEEMKRQGIVKKRAMKGYRYLNINFR